MQVSFIPMEYLSVDGYVEKTDIKNIDDIKSGSYKYFKNNDVIVAKITPCMENGKCALVDNLENGIGFGSSEFHVFRCNKEKILPRVLLGFLNRDIIRFNAERAMTGASGHRRVPISFYQNLVINLPSIEEQKQMLLRVDKIEKEIAILKNTQIDIIKEIDEIIKANLR